MTEETIRYEKLGTALRGTLKGFSVHVDKGRGKNVTMCVLKAFYGGEDMDDMLNEALERYSVLK